MEIYKSFFRWIDQESRPIKDLRYPNSQVPQDTKGGDGDLNTYDIP